MTPDSAPTGSQNAAAGSRPGGQVAGDEKSSIIDETKEQNPVDSGISVNAWVNLDESCRIESEVTGDELQIELGNGALGLAISEGMVDRLVSILAAGKEAFRLMDQTAGSDTTTEPGTRNAA